MTLSPDSGSESSFEDEYAQMSESELLAIATSYESLTDSAQTALRAEFARRHLEPPIIEELDEEPTLRNLITVRRYRDLSEAIVARSLVESAGIFCFLKDENLVRLDWQVSNFIGGIRLQVAAEDAAAANDLLDQPIPHTIAFEGDGEFDQPHCPECHSIDISFEGSNRKAALASLYLLAVPLPLGAPSWTCQNCGCHWTDESSINI
jgi:hypothetical protein